MVTQGGNMITRKNVNFTMATIFLNKDQNNEFSVDYF